MTICLMLEVNEAEAEDRLSSKATAGSETTRTGSGRVHCRRRPVLARPCAMVAGSASLGQQARIGKVHLGARVDQMLAQGLRERNSSRGLR